MIAMQRLVAVDSKVRTDINFPAGFMDVISIEKSNDKFRLLYDTKGRFVLHSVPEAEASFKLCRIVGDGVSGKSIPFIVTHDGRTIRYPDPLINKNDTVKLELSTGKVIGHLKFQNGQLAMITRGRNAGRVGVIQNIERHPGSFDIVHIKDSTGAIFATRLPNAFVIGEGADPKSAWISLPRDSGIRKTIFQERDARLRASHGRA